GVDRDVVAGEIAGPDAGGAAAGVEVHDDGDKLGEHFFVCDTLVEGMLAAAAADGDAGEADVNTLEIEWDACAAGGGEDAAPIGVGAGERGFYQRRIRHGERELGGGGGPVRGVWAGARGVGAPRTSISITRWAPSPSATIASASWRQTFSSAAVNCAKAGPSAVIFRAPEHPLARIATVSLVEVSPSMVMALNVGATARRRARVKSAGEIAASVATNASMVAMLG